MYNVSLEDALLREMGVDAVQVDLEEETRRGGPYFLPISQERMDSLDQRPDFHLPLDDMCLSPWWFYDADTICNTFISQLYCNNDGTCSEAWEGTHWRPRLYVLLGGCYPYFNLTFPYRSLRKSSTYENLLYEPWANRFEPDPKSNFEWHVCNHLVAAGFPHRSCLSIAGIPDVEGLIRSEMMVATGMMISAMREKGNVDVAVVPVSEASLYSQPK